MRASERHGSTRYRGLLLIPAALSLSACGGLDQLAWVKTLGAPVVWAGIVWTAVGAVAGLVIACLGLWLFRPRRERTGPIQLIVDAMAAVALLTVFPCTVAVITFFEGTLRASEHQLTEGEFAEQYFPTIGQAGADLIGTVLLTGDLAAVIDESAAGEARALTEAFRSGEHEIEAEAIPQMIASIDGGIVRDISEGIQNDIAQTVPGFDSGARRQILAWFMNNISGALMSSALEDDSDREGLGGTLNVFGQIVRELPDAAMREGDPAMLSHRETASFLAEVAISDGVVRYVVRPFCRIHQIGALLPLVLALVLPLIVLRRDRWLARFRRRRSAPPNAPG